MPYVIWSDMFMIKVPEIDAQHRQLIDIINDFHDAATSGAASQRVFEILNALIRYTQAHFSMEEQRMEHSSYPADKLNWHKGLHEQLVIDIFGVQEKLIQNAQTAVQELDRFLNAWLIQHILLVDKELSVYCLENR